MAAEEISVSVGGMKLTTYRVPGRALFVNGVLDVDAAMAELEAGNYVSLPTNIKVYEYMANQLPLIKTTGKVDTTPITIPRNCVGTVPGVTTARDITQDGKTLNTRPGFWCQYDAGLSQFTIIDPRIGNQYVRIKNYINIAHLSIDAQNYLANRRAAIMQMEGYDIASVKQYAINVYGAGTDNYRAYMLQQLFGRSMASDALIFGIGVGLILASAVSGGLLTPLAISALLYLGVALAAVGVIAMFVDGPFSTMFGTPQGKVLSGPTSTNGTVTCEMIEGADGSIHHLYQKDANSPVSSDTETPAGTSTIMNLAIGVGVVVAVAVGGYVVYVLAKGHKAKTEQKQVETRIKAQEAGVYVPPIPPSYNIGGRVASMGVSAAQKGGQIVYAGGQKLYGAAQSGYQAIRRPQPPPQPQPEQIPRPSEYQYSYA